MYGHLDTFLVIQAEIPDGLINWGKIGVCVHATSVNRSGPFIRQGVSLGPECHNPQVSYPHLTLIILTSCHLILTSSSPHPQALRDRPTGEYLLFHYVRCAVSPIR